MKARIAVLIVAVILAVLAVMLFAAHDRLGFALMGIGGVLVAILALPIPSVPPSVPTGESQWASGRRRWLAVLLLVIGSLLLLDAARLFIIQIQAHLTPTYEPWDRFASGLLLWVIGVMFITRNRISAVKGSLPLLLIILAVAAGARFYLLESIPQGIWYDESFQAIRALTSLHDANIRPIFAENHSFAQIFLYASALSVAGENNIAAMRGLEALISLLGIAAAYLLGKELRGAAFGMVFALVLATMRWALTFSRLGMNGIEIVFFALIALYFAERLIRHHQYRDAFLLGITLGSGMWFYRSIYSVIAAIALFLLLNWPYRVFRRSIGLALAILGSLVVIVFPLLIAILMQSGYFSRINEVSIFNERLPLGEALLHNFTAHVDMFHLIGDRNGRHNIPFAPMLDPLTGILFGWGGIIALRGWRRRENLYFLILLAAGLVPAIFSITFEAPQGLRSIAVIAAVAYFATLAVVTLADIAAAIMPRLKQRGWALMGGALLLIVLSVVNFDAYFRVQRTTYAAWAAHSTVETLVGRSVSNQDANTRVYVSQYYFNNTSALFLDAKATQHAQRVIPDLLPLRIPPDQPVVLYLAPDEQPLFQEAQQLYPNGIFETITSRAYGVEPPPDAPVLFYTVHLMPADLAAVQGLNAAGQGIFYASEYRDYPFVVPAGATLMVDEQSSGEGVFSLRLASGVHRISINPPDAPLQWVAEGKTEPIPVWLLFHDPVAYQGVRTTFFANANWEGDPVTIQTAPDIYEYVHILPMQRPYSVIYSGQLYAPETGHYGFRLTAIDEAELLIDGESVFVTPAPGEAVEQSLTLEAGWHAISVRFRAINNYTSVYLEWHRPDSDSMVPIAREYFHP